MTARIVLGLTQGGNFPGAIKTVAEWFPVRERALATGWFNAGTNTPMGLQCAMADVSRTRFPEPAGDDFKPRCDGSVRRGIRTRRCRLEGPS